MLGGRIIVISAGFILFGRDFRPVRGLLARISLFQSGYMFRGTIGGFWRFGAVPDRFQCSLCDGISVSQSNVFDAAQASGAIESGASLNLCAALQNASAFRGSGALRVWFGGEQGWRRSAETPLRRGGAGLAAFCRDAATPRFRVSKIASESG